MEHIYYDFQGKLTLMKLNTALAIFQTEAK